MAVRVALTLVLTTLLAPATAQETHEAMENVVVASARDEDRIVSIFEPVEYLDWHPDGQASLVIWEPSVRFGLNRQPASDFSSIEQLIDRSTEEGWSVTLQFNAQAGRFDEYSLSFIYPLCSITLRDERAGSDEACLEAPRTDASRTTAVDLIALGIALSRTDEFEEAKALLDRGLESPDLDPDIAFLAHRARGKAFIGLANRFSATDLAADPFLVQAVRDFLEIVDPERNRTMLDLASTLESLGAYNEALRIYTALPHSSANAVLHRSTRRSFTLRALGRPEEALRELQQIGHLEEFGQSMRYNIFLARTLIGMERYAEAISALDIGLSAQPDFAWAYFDRSCAHAALGHIEEALADQRAGYRFFLNYPEVESIQADENLHLAEARLGLLQRLAEEAPNNPAPEICRMRAPEFRDRSPLLDDLSLDLHELLNS